MNRLLSPKVLALVFVIALIVTSVIWFTFVQ